MKILKVLIFLVLIIFTDVFSQGGSAYSRHGVGDINMYFSTRRFALGGIALASFDQFDINTLNPAAYSVIRNTKFAGSIRYDEFYTKDQNSGKSFSNYFLESASFGIPVQRDYGISLIFALSPFSKVNYNIKSPIVLDTNKYDVTYTGEGGINNIIIGTSYANSILGHFGLNLNFFIGSIKNISKIEPVNQSYYATSFTTETKYKGFNLTLGYISPNISSIFNSEHLSDLRLGLSFSNVADLSTDKNELKTTYALDTLSYSNFITRIPYRFGTGISFQFNKKYNFNIDYLYQNFSGFSANSENSRFLQSLNYFSAGLEILPPQNPESFLNTITWRFGGGYKISEYNVFSKSINEFIISAGLTMPFDAMNSFDLGVQYAIRGTKDLGLQQDQIFRVILGLNFSEFWFVREED